jgi:ketosteroid isomerase-like protein
MKGIRKVAFAAGIITLFMVAFLAASPRALAALDFTPRNFLVNPPPDADPQVEANLDVMRRVDTAWNERDFETLEQLHAPDGVFFFTIPGGADRTAHVQEMRNFLAAFPDHQIELPHLVLFGQGDMVTAVSRSSGTHAEPFTLPDGRVIPPTGKVVNMVMTTVARVADGQFAEEIVTFDTLDFFSQLGVASINAEQPPAHPFQ